ncbi:MAG: tyrosine-protein phosphatase [Christensenellaceae bacterium]|jgi:protein-tyrosine phosphatase|nr:tyrosine-protein phosphatase [Christensenellaceae bacterium]
MEKIINFRDLGGIALENGRFVKTGFFFRSSSLDKATKSDICELKSYNFKLIFDFRDKFEKGTDKVYKKVGVTYINRPFMIESARIIKLNKKRTPSSLVQFVDEDMCIAYRNIPFGNASYQDLFSKIKAGTVPVLFHCTVGKDRTGVASAILLKMLGASRQAIIDDYMKTKRVEPNLLAATRRRFWMLFFMRDYIMKRMMPIFLTKELFIEATLDAIENKYSSYEEYFYNEFGYTHDDIATLREKYTESNQASPLSTNNITEDLQL